jgi:hypothetical protein
MGCCNCRTRKAGWTSPTTMRSESRNSPRSRAPRWTLCAQPDASAPPTRPGSTAYVENTRYPRRTRRTPSRNGSPSLGGRRASRATPAAGSGTSTPSGATRPRRADRRALPGRRPRSNSTPKGSRPRLRSPEEAGDDCRGVEQVPASRGEFADRLLLALECAKALRICEGEPRVVGVHGSRLHPGAMDSSGCS